MEKNLVQRALALLKEWGKCIYFDSSSSLSNIAVLDPQFLTQDVLAQLFNINPSLQDKRRNGIINHKDLSSFWNKFSSRKDFEQLCQNLIELMKYVLFLKKTNKIHFMNKEVLFPLFFLLQSLLN